MNKMKTAILMTITFAIDLGLLTYHTPFWIVCLVTVGIFGGGDIYYQHKSTQGGHEDE
jgi:hypothetical protein